MAMVMAAKIPRMEPVTRRFNLRSRSLAVRRWRRAIAAIASTVLGGFATAHAVALALASSNPALAHRLAPFDGRITGALSLSTTVSAGSDADRQRASRLAQDALTAEPTAVTAVTALGLNADAHDDKKRARRLFVFAELLSRRSVAAQLWLIEDAVASGDIPGALRHYDISLRVSPETADFLFPVLAAASSDPEIAPPLIHTLSTKPLWGEPFLSYLANSALDPRLTVGVFAKVQRAGLTVPASARAKVINSLAARGEVDLVWAYYVANRPGANRRKSRDPDFSSNLEAPTQLDWMTVAGPGISVTRDPGNFAFSVPPSSGGALIQQLQFLPPGTYRLRGQTAGISQNKDARPYWLLTCYDGRELGRLELPNSDVSNGNFSGTIEVPPNCAMQMLAMVARPTGATVGSSGQINSIQVEPAI
jgi:hypothetical protein